MHKIRGKIMVEWEDIGEGLSGDFDPTDPEDIPLLRFTVYKNNEDEIWGCEQIEDASYCTLTPTYTNDEVLEKLLDHIMDFIYEPASRGHSIKKLCERLSWITPEWVR